MGSGKSWSYGLDGSNHGPPAKAAAGAGCKAGTTAATVRTMRRADRMRPRLRTALTSTRGRVVLSPKRLELEATEDRHRSHPLSCRLRRHPLAVVAECSRTILCGAWPGVRIACDVASGHALATDAARSAPVRQSRDVRRERRSGQEEAVSCALSTVEARVARHPGHRCRDRRLAGLRPDGARGGRSPRERRRVGPVRFRRTHREDALRRR